MTVLVPKTDGDPEKKEKVNDESLITENEIEIKILPVNDEKILSEEKDENTTNFEIHIGKVEKRKITLLCLVWILCLVINQVIFAMGMTTIYRVDKMGLKAIHALFITLGSWLYLAATQKGKENDQLEISWLYYWRFIVPIVISMLARAAIDPWITWPSPIGETLTVTIDAFLPFFILSAANIVLEHNVPLVRIIVPGILGIVLCFYIPAHPGSIRPEKNILIFALLIALEFVFAKKVMEEKRMHPVRLLTHLGGIFLLLLIPIVVVEFFQYSDLNSVLRYLSPEYSIIWALQGVTCFVQTAVIFVIFSMVTPFEISVLSLVTHITATALMMPLYHYVLGSCDICYFV